MSPALLASFVVGVIIVVVVWGIVAAVGFYDDYDE